MPKRCGLLVDCYKINSWLRLYLLGYKSDYSNLCCLARTDTGALAEMMLAQTGLISMIGNAERGPEGFAVIKKHKSAYLMAVGDAAHLVSKAIKHAKVVGIADLGMEAIYEFDVVDMPVTVAVDSGGTSAHITGPAEWQKRIAESVRSGEFKGIAVAAS